MWVRGIKLKQAIYQLSPYKTPAPIKLSLLSVSGHLSDFHALAVVKDAIKKTEMALLQ